MSVSLKHLLAFAKVKGIGPARLRLLASRFGDLGLAWNAGEYDLISAGLDSKTTAAVSAAHREINPDAELEALEKSGVTALAWDDPAYPALLREIPEAPAILFIRGALTEADRWGIGIVGTRNVSAYGREVAETLSRDLAANRLTIVSGLARGVDGAAHQAALKAGGRTVAVLGSGVDVIYPPEHRRLAQQISESGAVISEYPLGTQPDAMNFPPRNRIISGLSLGVVVVEADEKSGALITTTYAAEQGRDVFAVPGGIFNKTSRGTNKLIQDGAKLVTCATDILEELNLEMVAKRTEAQLALPDDDAERNVLQTLTRDPMPIDDVIRRTNLPASVVAGALAMLELKGLARLADGAQYTRVS